MVAARTRPRGEAEDILSAAYALWVYRVEDELSEVTGHELPKRGTRSSRPTVVWRSVLPERRPDEGYPSEAILAWLKDLARELVRASGSDVTTEAKMRIADDIDLSLGRDMPSGEPCARVTRARAALLGELARFRARLDYPRPHAPRDPQPSPPGERHARQVEQAQGVMDAIDKDLQAQAQEDGAEERRRWRDWLKEDAAAGAAHAHAYSRLPDEWVPTQAMDSQGVISADPNLLLEAIRSAYAAKWQAAERQTRYAWREREALTRLQPDELRAASLAFSKRTASTFDGLHPRHFALLSDQALAALATIYEAVELLGAWPKQLDLVIMPLIPKPKGGFRPIGLLAGAYRLWAKARRGEADRWEAQNQRPYFAAAAGSGPLDAVWRQAVRQEAGVAQGNEAAAIVEDLESFYELMSRSRLLKEAERRGFPGPVVRTALAAYAAPRFLSLRGKISRETFPKVGIVAGCALATTFVKVYYISVYDQLAASIPPSVQVRVYIDDTIMTSEASPAKVVEDLVMARRRFIDLATNVMAGRIAEDKTGIVATTRSTASRLKWACGVEGPVKDAMEYLGVDYAAGRRRGVLRKGSKHVKRAQKAVLRRRRLAIIRSVIGERARTVYAVGIAPASAYDAPIWGLTDREVLAQRRTAAVAMRPRARGRSLTITNLLHGTPTARLEVAPVLHYSRAVWQAVVAREAAASRGCGLPDIGGWWNEAMGLYSGAAEAYEADGAASKSDAKKRIAKAWRGVRGPVGAALLSLARIGWRFRDAFRLEDDRGVEITLTHTTPQLLRDLLVDGVRRAMERQMARKWASTCKLYEGRRICVDLAVSALRPKAGTDPMGRGAYRASACGAIMTMHRAAQGGYDVCELCPRCRKFPDTVFHRIYGCETSEEALKDAVPQWFIQEARRADASDPFWVTGIFPHPADLAPLPEPTVKIVWDNGPDDAGAELGGASQRFGGQVYFDGSCRPNVIKDLTRAGGAVIMADAHGRPVRRAMAAVPAHLPQTAQTAENLAFVLSIRALDVPATVKGDCKTVVDAANAPCATVVAARRKHGGLIMDTLRDPARRRLAGRVEWVKAHRKLTGNEDAATRLDVLGNDAADAAANEAREAHPPPGPEAEAWAAYYTKRAPLVAKAAAAALPLFPPAPGNLPRKPKPKTADAAAGAAVHFWQFRAGAWRCAICAGWTREERATSRSGDQRCPGPRVLEQAAAFADKGHAICRTQGDLPIVFCSRCGGWAARRCHRLSRQCGAPTAAGRLALRRIDAGLHPWRKKQKGGGEEARSGARTVAALAPGKRGWVQVDGRNRRRRGDRPRDPAADGGRDLQRAEQPRAPVAHEEAPRDEPTEEGAAETEAMDIVLPPASRDPAVDGTSMSMVLAVLKRISADASAEDKASVFNGRTGRFLTTTVGALELERDWLRNMGVRDDDDGVGAPGMASPRVVPEAAGTCVEAAVRGTDRGRDALRNGDGSASTLGPRTCSGPNVTRTGPDGVETDRKRRRIGFMDDPSMAASLLPEVPGAALARGCHRPDPPRLPPRPARAALHLGGEGARARHRVHQPELPPGPLRLPPPRRGSALGRDGSDPGGGPRTAADTPAAANRARRQLLATLAAPKRARTQCGGADNDDGAGSDVAMAPGLACVDTSGGLPRAPGSDVALAASQACVHTREGQGGRMVAALGHSALVGNHGDLDSSSRDCNSSVAPGETAKRGDSGGSGTRVDGGGRKQQREEAVARDCSPACGLVDGGAALAVPGTEDVCSARDPPLALGQDVSLHKRRRLRGKSSTLTAAATLGDAPPPRPPAHALVLGVPAGSTSAGSSADAQPAR